MREPTEEPATTAGERIRAWRASQTPPVTQPTLAALIGVSVPHLSGVETGDRSVSLGVAVAIEQVTGIPVEVWVDAPERSAFAADAAFWRNQRRREMRRRLRRHLADLTRGKL